MSAQQAAIVAGRGLQLDTALVGGRPSDADSGADAPHITLSPVTRTGEKTTGFRFVLKAPSSGAASAVEGEGFSITVWVRDPAFGVWGSFVTLTGVDYGDLELTGDINASELYFSIGNIDVHGIIYLLVAEQ